MGRIPTMSRTSRTPTRLDAVKGNRAVFTDGTLAGEIYFTSPLSLPYVLERLTPALAQAVKGESPREMLRAP